MKFELNDYRKELTDEEIIEDIKRVAQELEHDYISISTYRKCGQYSQTAIQGHFGTWKNALSIAGLRNERTKSELKRIKNEDYYADLQRIAKQLNKDTVLYEEYRQYGKYAAEHVFSRFKTWDKALLAAGLQPTGLARSRIDEQTLFDELERIWTKLGRQPTSTDITKGNISKYSLDTYKRRFGGWRNALKAFVEYINLDSSEEIDEEELKENKINDKENISKTVNVEKPLQKKEHRTSRNINARMRFKILKRDNFKCCACGASPAKDPSVDLHVDHIIPWAKGGETVVDNLQTLCSKCNLGKGDME
ncbi:MAG TPA: HNH endonuclease [Eubacteriales bacterium]|nr:HNH endonuclease [Clostridia bacterium]HRV73524.1 HNH endonuclease [Eubacteriales bacterium]